MFLNKGCDISKNCPIVPLSSFFLFFSYTGSVVGNGLQAQGQNPEIKVRGVDPVLIGAKETLERFNQVKTHFVHISLSEGG